MRVGDIVAVLWRDSVSPVSSVWLRTSDIDDELPVIVSVGAVVKLTRTAVTLASSFAVEAGDEDEQLSGVMTIPRRTIVEVRDLEWTERG